LRRTLPIRVDPRLSAEGLDDQQSASGRTIGIKRPVAEQGKPLTKWGRRGHALAACRSLFARLSDLITASNLCVSFRETTECLLCVHQRFSAAVEEVRSELVGKAVVLTDGKAGTVDNVWLDELHGLRISIIGHIGKWPISTIKFAQGTAPASGAS
jgi:hypothetical protein